MAAQLSCGVLAAEGTPGPELMVLVLDVDGIRASMGLEPFAEDGSVGASVGTLTRKTSVLMT